MVLAHFANLLELPINSIDLLIKESRHKFQGTYVVLNGELQQISEIFLDNIVITDVKGGHKEVDTIKTLEPFLPPTGLYFPDENTAISLRKYASKQWRKSFCWDLYSAGMKHHFVPFKVFQAIKENNANTFNGIVFNKGIVYYLDKEIGERDSSNIYHVIPEFYQELVDLFGEDRVKMEDAVKPVKKKAGTKKVINPPAAVVLDYLLAIGTSSTGTITGGFDLGVSPYSTVKVSTSPSEPHMEEWYLNYFKEVINSETF